MSGGGAAAGAVARAVMTAAQSAGRLQRSAADLLAHVIGIRKMAKCSSGEKEEGRRGYIPPFSPGWLLQPGLKRGL
jgi:hypothetical protein